LAIDRGESDATVQSYVNSKNIEYPAISGTQGGGDAIIDDYGPFSEGYPTTILIAPDRDIIEQDLWPLSTIAPAIVNANIQEHDCDQTEIFTAEHAKINPVVQSTIMRVTAESITLSIASTGEYTLIAYTANGKITKELYRGCLQKGVHTLNRQNDVLANGIYLLKLQGRNTTSLVRLVVSE